MEYAILNGELIGRTLAKVDIEDRGYQFGDGVYEVIRVYNGKMFAVNEHLSRFEKSMIEIGIPLTYTTQQLVAPLKGLIEKNKLVDGIIYMQITRGVAPRNHSFPEGGVNPVLIAYTKEIKRPVLPLKYGVKTILTEDIRWLRCDIKSLNLLGNLLAKQKAAEEGSYEAIQHRGDLVTEGSSSNVFLVKNGRVVTHPSNHLILKGITKDIVLGICCQNNISVEERPFTTVELAEADEVFLTSTTAEVMPIVTIEEQNVKSGAPGPVVRKLQEWFGQEIERQCGPLKEKIPQ